MISCQYFPAVVVGLLGDKVDIEYDDGDKGGVRHGEGGVEIGEVSDADQCSFGCVLEREVGGDVGTE